MKSAVPAGAAGNARIARRRAGAPACGLGEGRGAAGRGANRSPDGRLLGGLPKQLFKASARPIVPGPRVDLRRLGANAITNGAMTRGIDLGDAIEQRSIECRKFLRHGLLVHTGSMPRYETDRNSPPVLPRGGRSA